MRFHLSTEMQPNFSTNQNVCSVHFSIIHPVKVTVQKIQFCFMIFITEFVASYMKCMKWPPDDLAHSQMRRGYLPVIGHVYSITELTGSDKQCQLK